VTLGEIHVADITNIATAAPPVEYGWLPPAQQVGGGANADLLVPAGYIHQTAWDEGGGPDIQGVYAKPNSGWQSMIWRWADTMRFAAIQHVTGPGGKPAYRMEVAPTDKSSPGTSPDSPRAELFSVDPGEKRRQRSASAGSVLRDGDEYWATFALYIPSDFPKNHRWATLWQRKFDDREGNSGSFLTWFTLNVHGTDLDVTIPGDAPFGINSAPFATLESNPTGPLPTVVDRWTQFTAHERLSSGNDGLAEFYVNGTRVMSLSGEPTVRAGDINFHFQYGYYRTNKPKGDGGTQGPGLGVVHYTPMLIKLGSTQGDVPALP